jgi:hypothetical protein
LRVASTTRRQSGEDVVHKIDIHKLADEAKLNSSHYKLIELAGARAECDELG